MSNLITSMCDDCKYVRYSFDGGSTKCGYRGKKDCNFIPREKKDLTKDKERGRSLNCVFGPLVQNTVKAAKKAAIKEFAERLKNKIWYSDWCNLERTITPEIITTVVKEMTEVQE